MSMHITQKEVKSTHLHTIAVPYCALQHLLRYRVPYAHTERREGWGADIYSIGTYAIATGYAPFGDVKPSHEILQKYEGVARVINNNNSLDYEGEKNVLEATIWIFLSEVCPDDN